MATVSKWTPFGVALDITAVSAGVTRTSATQFTVKINASWATYYGGAQTKYGMTASSGGGSATLKTFSNTAASSGSGSFTGTYSISGNGSSNKTITVTFKNFNTDNGDSATKNVSFIVVVPAWTSYVISYNANGGTGAPSSQTKWKGQTLTLSSTKPARSGYSFLGWSTSAVATTATYSAGGSYSSDAKATLYAVWKANTYTIKYNANGGTGAPSNQTKTHGKNLTLSLTKPTRENYTFKGWSTSSSATSVQYLAGGVYTLDSAATLYAVWELTYTKPQISSLKVSRCDSTGAFSDTGAYAWITFMWSVIKIPTDGTYISVDMYDGQGEPFFDGYLLALDDSTTGDLISQLIYGPFDPESSYTFEVHVDDGTTVTTRSVTMSGAEYHIDLGKDSVAIGKPAETLIGDNGNPFKAFDVKWRAKFRDNVCIGDKMYYHDGNQGIFLSYEGFMHLQRTTAQGNHPYLGFYLDDAQSANGMIRLNASTKLLEFLNAEGYRFSGDVLMNTNAAIRGYTTSGELVNAFQAKNDGGNTTVGFGNYDKKSGNTNIYGVDVMLCVASAPGSNQFRPYRRKGDSITLTLRTSGYVTNSGQDVSFWIPFAMPIVGTTTVTVASGSGFIFRQGTKYTHGSSANTYVTPTSYEATATFANGVYVKAVFSNTTNVTNNDSIGIYWNGTLTFS